MPKHVETQCWVTGSQTGSEYEVDVPQTQTTETVQTIMRNCQPLTGGPQMLTTAMSAVGVQLFTMYGGAVL